MSQNWAPRSIKKWCACKTCKPWVLTNKMYKRSPLMQWTVPRRVGQVDAHKKRRVRTFEIEVAAWWSLQVHTSSTAQGGGGSFKNMKTIGDIGCCESGMAERIHWWTERCLRSPLFLSLSLTIYLPTSLSSMYLSIYRSIYLSIYLSLSFSLSSNYLSTYLPIYQSTYLPIYLSLSLSSVYLSSCLPVCLSICLPVYLWCSVIQCNVV